MRVAMMILMHRLAPELCVPSDRDGGGSWLGFKNIAALSVCSNTASMPGSQPHLLQTQHSSHPLLKNGYFVAHRGRDTTNIVVRARN
jgi:hypothetical protein